MLSQPILAICLDVFGTTVRISKPARPYKHIVSRLPVAERPRAAEFIMSHPWSLREAAARLNVPHTETEMGTWERELSAELESVECYPETIDVLRALRTRGYALALCTNLAQPYAAPVDALIGKYFDVKVWSFESGCVKPSPEIYAKVVRGLDLPVHRILMAGDTELADYETPLTVGMHATHLVRNAPQGGRAKHQIENLQALLAQS